MDKYESMIYKKSIKTECITKAIERINSEPFEKYYIDWSDYNLRDDYYNIRLLEDGIYIVRLEEIMETEEDKETQYQKVDCDNVELFIALLEVEILQSIVDVQNLAIKRLTE